MKVATLDLTAELLMEFARASQYHNGIPRKFFVEQNPLPYDVKILGVRGTEIPGIVQLLLKSESFADVPEGETPPSVPPIIYKTVYDADFDIVGPFSKISLQGTEVAGEVMPYDLNSQC